MTDLQAKDESRTRWSPVELQAVAQRIVELQHATPSMGDLEAVRLGQGVLPTERQREIKQWQNVKRLDSYLEKLRANPVVTSTVAAVSTFEPIAPGSGVVEADPKPGLEGDAPMAMEESGAQSVSEALPNGAGVVQDLKSDATTDSTRGETVDSLLLVRDAQAVLSGAQAFLRAAATSDDSTLRLAHSLSGDSEDQVPPSGDSASQASGTSEDAKVDPADELLLSLDQADPGSSDAIKQVPSTESEAAPVRVEMSPCALPFVESPLQRPSPVSDAFATPQAAAIQTVVRMALTSLVSEDVLDRVMESVSLQTLLDNFSHALEKAVDREVNGEPEAESQPASMPADTRVLVAGFAGNEQKAIQNALQDLFQLRVWKPTQGQGVFESMAKACGVAVVPEAMGDDVTEMLRAHGIDIRVVLHQGSTSRLAERVAEAA